MTHFKRKKCRDPSMVVMAIRQQDVKTSSSLFMHFQHTGHQTRYCFTLATNFLKNTATGHLLLSTAHGTGRQGNRPGLMLSSFPLRMECQVASTKFSLTGLPEKQKLRMAQFIARVD